MMRRTEVEIPEPPEFETCASCGCNEDEEHKPSCSLSREWEILEAHGEFCGCIRCAYQRQLKEEGRA
jgi:hypothetical protein